MGMLNFNGPTGATPNGTTASGNITSAFSGLALNLLSAAGTVAISDLARSQGLNAAPTNNPLNPVQVLAPPNVQLQAGLQSVAGYLPIILLVALGAVAIVAFRRS